MEGVVVTCMFRRKNNSATIVVTGTGAPGAAAIPFVIT
jgi:hypothetical protein